MASGANVGLGSSPCIQTITIGAGNTWAFFTYGRGGWKAPCRAIRAVTAGNLKLCFVANAIQAPTIDADITNSVYGTVIASIEALAVGEMVEVQCYAVANNGVVGGTVSTNGMKIEIYF